MIENIKLHETPANLLLARLSEKEYRSLLPRLDRVDLIFGDVFYNPGDTINYVYFPESGVLSILAVEDQTTLELGIVGNEGMMGLPVFLEAPTSRARVIVQGAGSALRLKSTDFLKACEQSVLLSRLMRRYTCYLLMQISQTVVCSRLHLIESRLACLLMMMHDRMMTDRFQLKQEFLSKILGVRREAVTIAAGNLQKQQLISYSRGDLFIADAEGLQAACCNCYKIVTAEYLDLFAPQKPSVNN